jgi:hypothetical protein
MPKNWGPGPILNSPLLTLYISPRDYYYVLFWW